MAITQTHTTPPTTGSHHIATATRAWLEGQGKRYPTVRAPAARPPHLTSTVAEDGTTATFSEPDHIIRTDGSDPRDPDSADRDLRVTFLGDPRAIEPPEPWEP